VYILELEKRDENVNHSEFFDLINNVLYVKFGKHVYWFIGDSADLRNPLKPVNVSEQGNTKLVLSACKQVVNAYC